MKALEVAKYVVTKCNKDKCPISNLQLQKILYYIQHDFLKKITNHYLMMILRLGNLDRLFLASIMSSHI